VENTQEKLSKIILPLQIWYRENARVLPWRSNPEPYRVFVSEVMLQQTRVAAVLDYYTRFMEALPTVADLAAVEEDRLMKLWQGLGYYNRARNLQRAARQIMEDCGGEFPSDYERIRKLTGVGEYTAGAIASIAFGLPVPAVDGNVLRILSRILGDYSDISRPEVKRRWREELQKAMPRVQPGDFNQALMELGAVICLPNGAPHCVRCPVSECCFAFREGLTDTLPVKASARPRRIELRTVFLLFHNGKIAIRRRPDRGLLAGLWEYPNEIRPPEACLSGWGIKGKTARAGTGRHIFTHVEWHMSGLVVEVESAALPEGWRWADGAALRREYALPSAFRCYEPEVSRRLGMISESKAKGSGSRLL